MPYLTMRKKNLKLQLSPGLVASYDIQPGNGVVYSGTQHTPRTHTGVKVHRTQCIKIIENQQSHVVFQHNAP